MTSPRSSSVSNAEVFGAQRARLRVLAYRILGDMWDAEDAVQNAWLRFAETDLSTINDVDAWLTTVVSRAAIDVTRRRRTHQTLPVDDIAEPATPIDDPRADPERLILKDEQVAMAFTIVLRELSPVDRLSYMLHDVFGYPFAEIAEIAGRRGQEARVTRSPATARSRLGRDQTGAAPRGGRLPRRRTQRRDARSDRPSGSRCHPARRCGCDRPGRIASGRERSRPHAEDHRFRRRRRCPVRTHR
ncbi:hypothetical protein ABY45_15580 [Microbacterium maritypicum]